VDGEEDRREHRRGEPGLLAVEHADQQNGEGNGPDPPERRGADPAHRGPAIAASGRLSNRAIGEHLHPVLGKPDERDDDVRRHRQVGHDEHRQRHGEQDEVEVAERVGHSGWAGGARSL
jgi:hypothetical protein